MIARFGPLPLSLLLALFALAPVRADENEVVDPATTIDRLLADSWEQEGLTPSPAASDEEWHRRVWLDLAGVVPSRADTERYLADRSPNRDAALIERLLASAQYTRYWALFWQQILVGRGADGRAPDTRLFEWLTEAIADSVPYDRMVQELLTAEGYTPGNFPLRRMDSVVERYETEEAIDTGPTPAIYMMSFRTNGASGFNPPAAVGSTTKIFLGTRIECAECHNHPWESWTQEQFQGMEAFFKSTALRPIRGAPIDNEGTPQQRRLTISKLSDQENEENDPRARSFRMMLSGETPPELEALEKRIADVEERLRSSRLSTRQRRTAEQERTRLRSRLERVQENFEKARQRLLSNSATKELLEAQSFDPLFLGEVEVDEASVGTSGLRTEYADLVTSNRDGRFARTVANRLWAALFGRGIVHPVDDMRDSNPAANPELLDFLSGYIESIDYDLRTFLRTLASTKAYRTSSIANESNRDDEVYFSRQILTLPVVDRTTLVDLSGAQFGGDVQEQARVSAVDRGRPGGHIDRRAFLVFQEIFDRAVDRRLIDSVDDSEGGKLPENDRRSQSPNAGGHVDLGEFVLRVDFQERNDLDRLFIDAHDAAALSLVRRLSVRSEGVLDLVAGREGRSATVGDADRFAPGHGPPFGSEPGRACSRGVDRDREGRSFWGRGRFEGRFECLDVDRVCTHRDQGFDRRFSGGDLVGMVFGPESFDGSPVFGDLEDDLRWSFVPAHALPFGPHPRSCDRTPIDSHARSGRTAAGSPQSTSWRVRFASLCPENGVWTFLPRGLVPGKLAVVPAEKR